LVCKAEQSSGVLCAQDMLYCKNIIKSMGLKVKFPMLLKMDNKGAVNLANNWSIGGQTRHDDVWQCLLQESKESKIMDIHWTKAPENVQMHSQKILMVRHLKNALRLLLGRIST
jgi:hypothetical protein